MVVNINHIGSTEKVGDHLGPCDRSSASISKAVTVARLVVLPWNCGSGVRRHDEMEDLLLVVLVTKSIQIKLFAIKDTVSTTWPTFHHLGDAGLRKQLVAVLDDTHKLHTTLLEKVCSLDGCKEGIAFSERCL